MYKSCTRWAFIERRDPVGHIQVLRNKLRNHKRFKKKKKKHHPFRTDPGCRAASIPLHSAPQRPGECLPLAEDSLIGTSVSGFSKTVAVTTAPSCGSARDLLHGRERFSIRAQLRCGLDKSLFFISEIHSFT